MPGVRSGPVYDSVLLRKHCHDDPGHVSRAAHREQLARKALSREKTKATGRAEDSWENASERVRSERTSQWDVASQATSNTAEWEHAKRLQHRPRTAQRVTEPFGQAQTQCIVY